MLCFRSWVLIDLSIAYSGMLLWNITSSIFMDKVSETQRQLRRRQQQQQRIPTEETWGKHPHWNIFLYLSNYVCPFRIISNTQNNSCLFTSDNRIIYLCYDKYLPLLHFHHLPQLFGNIIPEIPSSKTSVSIGEKTTWLDSSPQIELRQPLWSSSVLEQQPASLT